MLRLDKSNCSVVLDLTGFYHRILTLSGLSGWCAGTVPTTQSSQELYEGPCQAPVQTATAEVRDQPLRYSLRTDHPENDSVVTRSFRGSDELQKQHRIAARLPSLYNLLAEANVYLCATCGHKTIKTTFILTCFFFLNLVYFKSVILTIFIITMYQFTCNNMKEVACCDEPAANYLLNLQHYGALERVSAQHSYSIIFVCSWQLLFSE